MLTLEELRDPVAPARIAKALGMHPPETWRNACHAVALAFVKACPPILPSPGRVARGFAVGIASQHSWVVLGDPYDRKATIVDPTLWPNRGEPERGIWVGTLEEEQHFPHGGMGTIWSYGQPVHQGGETIVLEGLGAEATRFLEMVGPLDLQGWRTLLHAPVGGGWPAKEIHTAAWQDERLRYAAPIDIVGMVTDLNPSGLYLPEEV